MVLAVAAGPDFEKYIYVISPGNEAYGAKNGERERLVEGGVPEDRQSDEDEDRAKREKENRENETPQRQRRGSQGRRRIGIKSGRSKSASVHL